MENKLNKLKVEWQEHNRAYGLSWNEIGELFNQVETLLKEDVMPKAEVVHDLKDNRTELQKEFERKTPSIKGITGKEYLQTFVSWLHHKIEEDAEKRYNEADSHYWPGKHGEMGWVKKLIEIASGHKLKED